MRSCGLSARWQSRNGCRRIKGPQKGYLMISSLSLTLSHLGGVGESVFHSVPDVARNFHAIAARPGHERNLMSPDFAANDGDRITEGEDLFLVPGGGSGLELS